MVGYQHNDGMGMVIVSKQGVANLSIHGEDFVITFYINGKSFTFDTKRSDLKSMGDLPQDIKKLIEVK